MKILVLNTYDNGGGAANAAFRLVEALYNQGIDITLGVKEKRTDAIFVSELPKKKHYISILYKYFLKILYKYFSKTTNQIHTSFDVVTSIDIDWINKSDYDIVHLHWLHDDMVSIKDICKIKKKIVWTLHDSWVCCGAEHHPNVIENDTRWQQGYYKTNKPKSTKGVDCCRLIWNIKQKAWKTFKPVYIAPSNWEKDVLCSSALFRNAKCFVIPNLINHAEFKTLNKSIVRKELNIPEDKIVLGFGAAYGVDNPRSMKGTYYLIEALKLLRNKEQYFLVIFGNPTESFTSKLNIPFKICGFISDNSLLAKVYNSMDIFLNPSLIENLPTTCVESICCSVPVVAFDVGGTKDVIEHKINGYLSKPYDSQDFINGIIYCNENISFLINNCEKKVKKDFNNDELIKKHIEIYTQI